MRVEHGAPLLTPERGNVRREDPRQRSEGVPASSGSSYRVQISPEARDLHSSQVRRSGKAEDVGDLKDVRLERIRERIQAGFYDSPEVESSLAETILGLYRL